MKTTQISSTNGTVSDLCPPAIRFQSVQSSSTLVHSTKSDRLPRSIPGQKGQISSKRLSTFHLALSLSLRFDLQIPRHSAVLQSDLHKVSTRAVHIRILTSPCGSMNRDSDPLFPCLCYKSLFVLICFFFFLCVVADA